MGSGARPLTSRAQDEGLLPPRPRRRHARHGERVRRLHALLSSSGAGNPECWAAQLAKGELRGHSQTTCWMLVITTSRHAVWCDYLVVTQVGASPSLGLA